MFAYRIECMGAKEWTKGRKSENRRKKGKNAKKGVDKGREEVVIYTSAQARGASGEAL